VVQVVTLVDRQEGGAEAVRAQVPSVAAVVTIEDLMAFHRKVNGEKSIEKSNG
jgi:orotate phosphoribosyltransferase